MSKRTVYFGPPAGRYESASFPAFVQQISEKLADQGRCNEEHHGPHSITYHFPDAGLGITYARINEHRCIVDIMGSSSLLEEMTSFIFAEDNKPAQKA
ncbi:hypothetical protein HYZ97_00325 [Candidatus Pacearchaeota archaeon]|nr:hypothetical protein [Candidatus Pacearchaeota archaeon]